MHRTLLLVLSTTMLMAADPLLIDAGLDARAWKFHDGSEFPGAKGGLRADGDGLALTWDFTGGGSYVSAMHAGPFPAGTATVCATVSSAQRCWLNWRWSDRSGRTMQGTAIELAPGEVRTLAVARSGPWSTSWGGSNGAPLGEDCAGVSLMVANQAGGSATGAVMLRRLEAIPTTAIPYPVALPTLDGEFAGWRLRGRWLAQWGRPVFDGVAERAGGEDGRLTFTLPRLGRDWTWRADLRGGQVPLRFSVPLADGGNPRAVYRMEVALEAGPQRFARSVILAGCRSATSGLGQPRATRDLPPNTFGTCLHLSYGRSGSFAGWSQTERLLDEVAACGLGWVRDGVGLKKGAAGAWQVDPYDIAWLRAARERGIRPIVVIDMSASLSPEEFAAQCTAIAEQTRDLVTVYELGNEPNNFGGWVKKFGGTWNGREKDNSTSPWVKAHLANTNAGAEAIRRIRPDVSILALGACTPTNFRYLDLGLSPAADGVVDHPYSFCMPAERVPYGHGLTARDGVQVGDAEHSFTGLVRSYHEKFAAMGQPRRLWITEFGWSTFVFDGHNEKGLYAGFSERAQSIYLVRRWLLGQALGIPASCQYDLLDDYGSDAKEAEANFGLLRGDYSRKPAWYAAQRMCSLFSGLEPDPALSATAAKAPLHRGVERTVLVAKWDDARLEADNGVQVLAFRDPRLADERTLAVWSSLPASGEFSPRSVQVRVPGWAAADALAIDVLSGACMDVPHRQDGGDLVLTLSIGDAPLAIRLFRD